MSPEGKWPWSVLGLDAMPAEAKDIRRAYARALKQIDQATDITGFSNLRAAYENALALREGRTIRNDHTRARKAEAAQDTPAVATATSEATERPAPTPTPTPPPTAEELAATARAQELDTLLTFLATENVVMSGGARINQALDNPLSRHPDHADAIRFAIVQVIRSRFRQTHDESVLSPQIDKATMLRLNDAYGWLTDFGAFRRDFWNNTNLLDAMATRAYGSIRVATPPPAPPKTRGGRAWLWAKTHATLLTVCYIGFIVAASTVANNGPVGVAIFNLLMWMILLPIVLALFMVAYMVLNGAYVMLRGVWRTLMDRSQVLRARFGAKK